LLTLPSGLRSQEILLEKSPKQLPAKKRKKRFRISLIIDAIKA